MKNLKDKLSTIVGIVILIAGSIDTYIKTLNDADINWFQLVFTVGAAVVAYLTGKAVNGTTKKL